jgi:hypothetical protein
MRVKRARPQRLEQDTTIVENTQKVEEQKIVEPTREIKQKRGQDNFSEEPDVEGTGAQAAEITMDIVVCQEKQKSKGKFMATEDAQKKSRLEDDYVSTMQDQSLEQMEVRSLQSEDDSASSVQAPSPKRPKKLKVERRGKPPRREKKQNKGILP